MNVKSATAVRLLGETATKVDGVLGPDSARMLDRNWSTEFQNSRKVFAQALDRIELVRTKAGSVLESVPEEHMSRLDAAIPALREQLARMDEDLIPDKPVLHEFQQALNDVVAGARATGDDQMQAAQRQVSEGFELLNTEAPPPKDFELLNVEPAPANETVNVVVPQRARGA